MNLANEKFRKLLALSLVAATLIVFWPVNTFKFVNYDDPEYVTANPHVLSGLTASNVRWAFTTGEMGSWHPLTWLALQADAQFFSASPRAYHLTNLALHVANTMLVFSLLVALTGAQLRAALVAALFALHPLHVETVAWVADRKDLLATFFALLSLKCYATYAQARGTTPNKQRHRPYSYLLSLLAFAAALMSKPSVIPLSVVMLLLDFWPLHRFDLSTIKNQYSSILREKIPFALLAVADTALTFATQSQDGDLVPLPLLMRLANAPIACAHYLSQAFWPQNLSVFYPHHGWWPPIVTWLASLLVVVISALAILRRRKWPQVFVGWFWLLAMLLPVLGLVQSGAHAYADRYTYFPLLGIFIAVIWSVPNSIARVNWPLAMAVILSYAFTTRAQLHHWRDSETLFTHAIAVTRGNHIAENNLGVVHLERGDVAVAAEHFRASLAFRPGYPFAHNNLGLAHAASNQTAEAEAEFRAATQYDSNYAEAHRNLGTMLARRGEFTAAATEYQLALAHGLDTPEVRDNLARAQAALK